MIREYTIQVNDYMTPIKVKLTENEAHAVAYVLEEIAKADKDSLVGIEDDDGNELYGNYNEWIMTHNGKDKTKQIEDRIKFLIDIANSNFKLYGWNHSHELRLARIDGMLEILKFLTEKDYYYDENGLHER